MTEVAAPSWPRLDKIISPEFRLTVACCRLAFAGDNREQVYELAALVDWSRFIFTVRFHRVQGLVWKSLSSLGKVGPFNIVGQLIPDARAIAATNLCIAVESQKLRAASAQAGLDMLFVKGLTVGSLAYQDSLLKMGWDIDLLISPAQVGKAATVLRECGYRLIVPAAPERLKSWDRLLKDSVWVNEQNIYIELHTRLAENRRLIPTIDVHSPSRNVMVAPGIALPTLQQDELFAYLCVHGASSLWFRLKWITDLAAILHKVDQVEINRLQVRARQLGTGRASGAALLLADTLYGTLGGSPLRTELERDRACYWLYQASLRQLAGRREPREPTAVVGGTAAIHLGQLLLLPDASFKLGETFRQLRAALANRSHALDANAGLPQRCATTRTPTVDEYPS